MNDFINKIDISIYGFVYGLNNNKHDPVDSKYIRTSGLFQFIVALLFIIFCVQVAKTIFDGNGFLFLVVLAKCVCLCITMYLTFKFFYEFFSLKSIVVNLSCLVAFALIYKSGIESRNKFISYILELIVYVAYIFCVFKYVVYPYTIYTVAPQQTVNSYLTEIML